MDQGEQIVEAVEKLREESKERNFLQTVDLIVNLRNIDLSDPENRFSSDVILPNGRGKEREICVIADSKLSQAKSLDVNTLSEGNLEDLKGNKDEIKRVAEENDFFLAEAPLMPKIGKILGPVLGPRGKMPKPFPPDENLEELLGKSVRSLTIKVGEEPLLQFPVGTEQMEPPQIEENVSAVLNEIEDNLPKGPQQIGSVYLKLTMSKPMRVV